MMRFKITTLLAGCALAVAPAAATAAPADAAIGNTFGAQTLMAASGPASPASDTTREDVCFTGGCGSATVQWQSEYAATVGMSVDDNDCDGHSVEIRVIGDQFSYSNQTEYWTNGPWHVNHNGCHGGYAVWNGLGWDGNDPTMGFKVEICVVGGRCQKSAEMYNPYY